MIPWMIRSSLVGRRMDRAFRVHFGGELIPFPFTLVVGLVEDLAVLGATPSRTGGRGPGGGNGRHAILRGWCRKASRFESGPGHSVIVGQ